MFLTIFPELARNAMLQGQDRQYRLWLWLRALDEDGKGWIEIEEARRHWPQSDRNLHRALSKGHDRWWAIDRGRAFLGSSFNVGCSLGSTLGPPVVVSSSECDTVGKFRAQCFAAWFWKQRTISLLRLTKLFGKSKATIRKWVKKAGVHVQQNFVEYVPPDDGKLTPDGRSGGIWFVGGKRIEQIVNTYHNRDQDSRPRHRRTDKRLRQTLNMGKGQYHRLYFDDWGAANRALQAGAKEVRVRTERTRYGRAIWEREINCTA